MYSITLEGRGGPSDVMENFINFFFVLNPSLKHFCEVFSPKIFSYQNDSEWPKMDLT